MNAIIDTVYIVVSANNYNQFKDKKHQIDIDKIFEWVLRKNEINRVYDFIIKQDKNILEYIVANIGEIKIKNKAVLFFATTILTNGLSPRATSRLFLVDKSKKEKIGYYYCGGDFQFLPKIQNDSLIFRLDDGTCNQSTTINFKDSIPQNIFIHCKEIEWQMYGDIYKFEK